MSIWWVSAPSETRLTEVIEAASGVCTLIGEPYDAVDGTDVSVGRGPVPGRGRGQVGRGRGRFDRGGRPEGGAAGVDVHATAAVEHLARPVHHGRTVVHAARAADRGPRPGVRVEEERVVLVRPDRE